MASMKELEQELARLRAENQALRDSKSMPVSMKVSDKGCVSIFGIGRYGVTLYAKQWQKIIPLIKSGALEKFIEDNKSKLTWDKVS
jgi:hypothetical protein